MSQDAITDPDASTLIVAAEWLSGLFMAPMSSQQVAQAGSASGQNALRWIGTQLQAPAAAEALCDKLTQDTPENLAVHLQRRYTALFEGIFRHRAVLPYESAWQENGVPTLEGKPVAEMEAILRDLDVHVSADCCEPADHLAIELAALTAALDGGYTSVTTELVRRLQGWVPGFVQSLENLDPEGFYAGSGKLLLALIRTAQSVLFMTDPAVVSANEQCEGEFA